MSALDLVALAVALIAGALATLLVVRPRPPASAAGGAPPPATRILFPFVGAELSDRGLDAALRLARAEHATLVPAHLATVPLALTLDAPFPSSCDDAFAVFEAIEQRAARAGVPVDARIARGRSRRHALRRLLDEVPADRIVVAVGTAPDGDGFSADDVAWLMRTAPGEVVALRPPPRERVRVA